MSMEAKLGKYLKQGWVPIFWDLCSKTAFMYKGWHLKISNIIVKFKIDSGAEATLICKQTFNKMNPKLKLVQQKIGCSIDQDHKQVGGSVQSLY